MNLSNNIYEKKIFNRRLSSNIYKKRFYISGNLLSKEKEEYIYNYNKNNKKNINNFFLPSLDSFSHSRQNDSTNTTNNILFYKYKNSVSEFRTYESRNNRTHISNKRSNINKTLELQINKPYKVYKLIKPKLLNKPTSQLISFIKEEKKDKKIENQFKKNNNLLYKKINDLGIKRIANTIRFTKLLSENRDFVKDLNIKKENWHKSIRNALINDINTYFTKGKQYKNFCLNIEHKVNYFYDICIFPHFKNNFMFHKLNFINGKVMREQLCDKNCISKDIEYSLHRKRIKTLYINEEEEEKLIREEELKKQIEFEKHHQHMLDNKFELEDFFNKKFDIGNVNFACEKDRNYVYNQKIKRYYFDF